MIHLNVFNPSLHHLEECSGYTLIVLSYTQAYVPDLLETRVVLLTAKLALFLKLSPPAGINGGSISSSYIRTIY